MKFGASVLLVLIGLVLASVAHAAPPAAHHKKDDGLLYHWKQVRDKDGGITLLSTYPAPVPFSLNGGPEASLGVDVAMLSPDENRLSDIVAHEVADLRKTVVLAEYMEQDGRKPDHGIAVWYETIAGTRVAFIKYRGRGVVGGPTRLPCTAIHTIFVKSNRVVFTHLIVIFAGHQDEDRRDQRRIVRTMIETAPK